ncbi:MAG: hypothetical protein ABIJ33_02190 [Patescibacteria group bacterium]|nr:hypothetical protein [Patescibacteria group bacterium]
MTKVQLSLTDQEATILSDYGSQFGYNLPKTIRFVISKTTEQVLKEAIPTFAMSHQTEKVALGALEDYKQGKTHKIEDVDKFLRSL